jgi:hypothetical protein
MFPGLPFADLAAMGKSRLLINQILQDKPPMSAKKRHMVIFGYQILTRNPGLK